MAQQPERPSTVPADAVWLPDEGAWRLQQGNGAQAATIPLRLWRADGTPEFEGLLENGTFQGPFKRFHPDGALSREGVYRDGELDGVVVAYASEAQGAEPLRGCCVPPGAARMDARYRDGSLHRENFFDADGHALLSDGSRRPKRAENVPDDAEYEESSQRWYVTSHDAVTHSAHGTFRWWRLDGTLSEEADFDHDHRVAVRHYDEAGSLAESIALLKHQGYEEVRDGAWWCRLGQRASFDVEHAVAVRGQFRNGQAVGIWSFEDAAGKSCLNRDLGSAIEQDDGPAAYAEVLRDEREAGLPPRAVRAEQLLAAGRVRAALLADIRGLRGDAVALGERLRACTLPVAPTEATRIARAAIDVESRTVSGLLDGLIRGGEPFAMVRALATEVGGVGQAALDLIDAALALDPTREEAYLTRALLYIERGLDKQALEDADRLARTSQETAAFLREYLRIIRPTFDFWPSRQEIPDLPEEIPISVEQPLDRIRHLVQVYATRLHLLRQGLLLRRPDAPGWLPPALPALLPGGPLELRDHEAVIMDEGDQGQSEETRVTIAETVDTEALKVAGVPAQMRLVRAAWTGLCWLLWSVGNSEIAMPRDVNVHPRYAHALGMSLSRAWRAKDSLVTGGLRAMTQGVPGFKWEGVEIQELPQIFAEIACDEYQEMRAVLLWLSNEGNLSPFQSDLRQI